MSDITPWRPHQEDPWFGDLNRFFWEKPLAMLGQNLTALRGWGPAVDVTEGEREIVVRAEIPGARPEDLDVTVTEDAVSVSGEVKQDIDSVSGGYRRIERRYGSFSRRVPLPTSVKHAEAKAEYKNGILEVRVPKAEGAQSRATRLRLSGERPPVQ